jgi:hypothetical protein
MMRHPVAGYVDVQAYASMLNPCALVKLRALWKCWKRRLRVVVMLARVHVLAHHQTHPIGRINKFSAPSVHYCSVAVILCHYDGPSSCGLTH